MQAARKMHPKQTAIPGRAKGADGEAATMNEIIKDCRENAWDFNRHFSFSFHSERSTEICYIPNRIKLGNKLPACVHPFIVIFMSLALSQSAWSRTSAWSANRQQGRVVLRRSDRRLSTGFHAAADGFAGEFFLAVDKTRNRTLPPPEAIVDGQLGLESFIG